MSEMLSQIYTLLMHTILPQLQRIEAAQAEQRAHHETVTRNLQDLHSEIQIRFAELRAEVGACRLEIEDAMVVIRERDAVEQTEASDRRKKRLIH